MAHDSYDWDDSYMAPDSSLVLGEANDDDGIDVPAAGHQQGMAGDGTPEEIDEAKIRYETLLHAMAVTTEGGDDFSQHLALLDNSDSEGEGEGEVQGHVSKFPVSESSPDTEELADLMDVVDLSSASPDPVHHSNLMKDYREWVPDPVLGEESTEVLDEESSPNPPPKNQRRSSLSKQAAAVTGFLGFGKKAKELKEAKQVNSVIKRGVSQEETEKARKSIMLGVDVDAPGTARYQFSEERHLSIERILSERHLCSVSTARQLDMMVVSENPEEEQETMEERSLRVGNSAHKFAKLGRLQSLTSCLEDENMKPCELDRHDGWTLLHTAAEAGQSPVVAWVVRYHEPLLSDDGSVVSAGNVPATAKTGQGWTAAHVAAAHGHEEVLEVLSELGADLQAVDKSGASPLHSAAGSGCIAAIKLLASHGCDLDAVTNDGATATYVAAGNGFEDVVRLLGELGANVNIPTYDGWTPAQIANEMGATKVLHVLSDLVVASLDEAPSQESLVPDVSSHVVHKEARAAPKLPTVPDGFVYREVHFDETHTSLNIMIAAGVGNFPIVTKVNEGSPCEAAGIAPADLIVGVTPSINLVPISDPDDEASRLYPGELLLLRTHEEALAILPRSGRPVTITFMSRLPEDSTLEGPWVCPTCTFENEDGDICSMCNHEYGADSPLPPPPPESPATPVASAEWECGVCTFHNPNTSASCEMCGTSNPQEPALPQSVGKKSAPSSAWREVESPEYPGQFYFLNDETGVAQWERPAEMTSLPPPPVASPPARRASIESTQEFYGADFPIDVAEWVHDSLNLSSVQEMKLLEGMCGHESEFGVMELEDLKEIDVAYMEKLLDLVPIAKRRKFQRAMELLKSK